MTKGPDFPEADLTRGLRALAAKQSTDHPLPHPHLLWIKAQLEERAERRERALRPILIAERVALVVFALLGGIVLIGVADWIEARSGQFSDPEVFAWAVAGVCLFVVGFAFVLKPLMNRE